MLRRGTNSRISPPMDFVGGTCMPSQTFLARSITFLENVEQAKLNAREEEFIA
jgi:hypothetical protein